MIKLEMSDKPDTLVKLNGFELHGWDMSDREGEEKTIDVRSDLISVEVMDQNLRGGLLEQVRC